jgi:hypothetical protein
MRTREALLAALLLGCAAAKSLRGEVPRSALPAPSLPSALDGRAGRAVPLGPSEERLVTFSGAHLVRHRYGTSQVALLSASGIREHHPPSVCLKSTGHEVVQRTEESAPAGCLVRLQVRAGASVEHFYYTYLSGRSVTCSYWRRAATSAWAVLKGKPMQWSTVQVMDRDPARARTLILTLLEHLTRRTP